ncbi:glycosyltransferase [Vibrio sp. MMG022]|uniref:glycosyltransferase family 4 protein n=1 Tax=Vibrio sp. MMG023 TaxID=2909979 RepID=UPI001F27FF5E|nr:glycosyltransferase [Vibrio sp. MMG023]MCF6453910.1 glycosyltransferase [Vibrio sp. MMG023]
MKKKILIVNTSSFPNIGGVENSLNFIAIEFIKKGYQTEVVSFSNKIEEVSSIENNGVKYEIYPLKTNSLDRVWNRYSIYKKAKVVLKNKLKNNEYEKILSRSTLLSYLLLKEGGEVNTIFPTTANLNYLGLNDSKKSSNRKAATLNKLKLKLDYLIMSYIENKIVSSRFNRSIVFSNLMKSELIKSYKSKSVDVIPPGIDNDLYSTRNLEKTHDRNYFIYVGRLSVAKNIYEMIDEYINSGVKAELKIVGDGVERQRLEEYLHKNDTFKVISLIGSKSAKELPELYHGAIATILPTRVETFGQVIIESMAMGTPVIAYSSFAEETKNAVSEIIHSKELGYVINEYKNGELSKMIKKVFENHKQFNNLNCIRETEKYSWECFVTKLMENETN